MHKHPESRLSFGRELVIHPPPDDRSSSTGKEAIRVRGRAATMRLEGATAMSVQSRALGQAAGNSRLRSVVPVAIGILLLRVALWPLAAVRRFQARGIERERLARMDDRLLRDIGLTRADVWAANDRTAWRI